MLRGYLRDNDLEVIRARVGHPFWILSLCHAMNESMPTVDEGVKVRGWFRIWCRIVRKSEEKAATVTPRDCDSPRS